MPNSKDPIKLKEYRNKQREISLKNGNRPPSNLCKHHSKETKIKIKGK